MRQDYGGKKFQYFLPRELRCLKFSVGAVLSFIAF